ncbi:MAG: ATP-dependent RecD-like DNA helicase [Lachnospiraceae bacterium]|nr:ATP-dependent RecD-like DNA helicase [Lachnospiraceae bacterium]
MIVEGCVDSIIFRNTENGYTILRLSVQGEKETTTCVGNFSYVSEGDYLRCEGELTKHQLYGMQVHVTKYEAIEPTDAASMEAYLGSGAIKGVGRALAARIVKKFGEETFRIIEDEPIRLADIKGISERMAREISEQFDEKREQRQSMMFLQQYGISSNLAVKIHKQYGPAMYEIIRTNPYRLAEDISGVGFKTVDEIAAKVGISGDSEFRIRAGILYALSEAAGQGHTYLPQEKLTGFVKDLLYVDPEEIERQTDKLILERKLVAKKDSEDNLCVYSSVFYYTELGVARMLLDLNVKCPVREDALEERIAEIEKNLGVELDTLQRQAVAEAAKNGVFILTGGPGTGKTTTIKAIIRLFEMEGLDILLAAPTGRAAKRIYETTGREASTIHRLLELKVNEDLTSAEHRGSGTLTFERNAENPLEADVIIIDEMSMVDISLMSALLKAVAVGARLIMVGDVNQLPSVGPGNVLRDMINSGAFNTVRLNTIFRQALTSDIVVNAHKINNGEELALDNKSNDFFFMQRDDADTVAAVVVALVRDKLPSFVHSKSYDIQVLTPMRKGELGVEKLNSVLQHYLNPAVPGKIEKEHHGVTFREGDKVMQIKNNYQAVWEVRNAKGYLTESGTGIFNGDCGVIRQINIYAETMTIDFDEGKLVDYPFSQLDELELAYAVTIHKSQGSEYPAVVLPLLAGPPLLLNRYLLYTAVTRAKNCVTIVGRRETVRSMIRNASEIKRYSGLADRIAEMN